MLSFNLLLKILKNKTLYLKTVDVDVLKSYLKSCNYVKTLPKIFGSQVPLYQIKGLFCLKICLVLSIFWPICHCCVWTCVQFRSVMNLHAFVLTPWSSPPFILLPLYHKMYLYWDLSSYIFIISSDVEALKDFPWVHSFLCLSTFC